MGAQLRVYRRRIRSVQSTKKITRAMELIAASRIAKAQARVEAAQPYADAITRAVSAVATQSSTEHPLTTAVENPTRAAMLLVTSDRGLAGAYNANALRTGEELTQLMRDDGKDPVPYLVGRKAAAYYRFRNREIAGEWSGFSEQPTYDDAKAVADALIEAFVQPTEEGGVDEIHIVYTEFVSALTQRPKTVRVLPLAVVESDEPPPDGILPLYEFEPSGEEVLDALLPRYVESRIYESRDRQRGRPDQELHPACQRGAPGRNHAGNLRDRRRRRRPRSNRE